ncbi:hypothetical protein ACFQAT_05650 [Undibacterium arcticum]|uniref:Uncharacterized protein n=1 Tax=Undibacterium arcticum TaxID=1762892 RepID=A0ABV7FB52_9BURK
MCVFVKGKIVETDTKIYEFSDQSLAEKFINCLVNMDENSSCKQVPAVTITAKPGNPFSNLWAKVSYVFQQASGRVT